LSIDKTAKMLAADAVRQQMTKVPVTSSTNDFLFQLYTGISDSVLTPLMIESVLAILIGLGLIIGTRWMPKRDATTVEA
jgi:hypothetical protein